MAGGEGRQPRSSRPFPLVTKELTTESQRTQRKTQKKKKKNGHKG
jgi:hypothetical protein